MGRIFEIEYEVASDTINNIYTEKFYINSFKINGEKHEYYCRHVFFGFNSFKDEVERLKRKYLYSNDILKDMIFVFQVIDGQTKICQSLSSEGIEIEMKITRGSTFSHRLHGELTPEVIKAMIAYEKNKHTASETEERLYKMYGSYLEKEYKGGIDMEETNFATLGSYMSFMDKLAKEYKGGKIMESIKNVFVNEKEGVTVVVFNNGDKVKVTREKSEKNDIEKAIAIAIVKYYFGLDYYINACDKVVKAEKKEKVKKTIKKTNKKEEK